MKRIYLGVFLISFATLAFEVSLIRFFSIAQWYHFAFMVVSIAMFGIAAAGTFLAIRQLKNPLAKSSILFSITAPMGFLITNQLNFDPYKAILSYSHILLLLMYYILLGLPFFFFGIIIAFALREYKDIAGKIYFYNLAGSAFGSLLVLPLISIFNIKLIVIISIISLFSALCFTNKIKKILILITVFLLLFIVPIDIKISNYKELNQALNYPNSRLISTDYNSFSRVDVVDSSFTRYAPGLSLQYQQRLPEQLGVLVDAGNMDAVTEYGNLEFLDYLPNAVAFELLQTPKTLVINSGTGLDVLLALKNNADVTALETNSIVVDLLRNQYKDFSGNIYNKAEVYIEEGRSFIKRDEKYDLIIISLAGNVLSSSAGLYSLSENYILTVDAFKDYYDSLTGKGVLIVTRWLLYPPRESLRLMSIALEVADKENIAMFRSLQTSTLIIGKNKLDYNKIKDFSEKNKYDIIYLPANFTPNIYAKFKEPYYYNSINNLIKNKTEFYNNYIFDITPVYDDKPFYFNFFKWSKIKEIQEITHQYNPFFDSGFLLLFILIQAIILSIIFILLPLKVFKKTNIKKLPLVYFFFIGIAFMFIEIVLIQRFILFFGQVIYSVAVIISSLLLFSSLGSLYSQKLKTDRLKLIIIILFLLIIIYNLILPTILSKLIILNLIQKIILTIIMISPLSFLMGMPFPLAIRKIDKSLIAWGFAVNGSASVLSTVIAVVIALSFGYSSVFVIAGFLYLATVLFL